jgi:molybdopterin molybdotransferase
MAGLISVEEAAGRIITAARPTGTETVPVSEACGRVLAGPIVAGRTQPPFAASAMDGYALRAVDLAAGGGTLRVIGESAAGRGFAGAVAAGEAVRIFTGAPVPTGADTILIQENARREGNVVHALGGEQPGRFVRQAGIDFKAGDSFFAAGHRLRGRDMALAASLGPATALVRRRPRVAVLATGDELVLPGERPGPDQIVAANQVTVVALAAAAGGETRFLGIARDSLPDIAARIGEARDWGADLLVTIGGASVGDHDLVQRALADAGMALDFWRIAMRPGKPLMFGGLPGMLALGLPGNPASAIVCAHVFLSPLVAALSGASDAGADRSLPGVLGRGLQANDMRAEYMRASIRRTGDGPTVLTPFASQDSSLTSVLAMADALLIRPAFAPAAGAGDPCRFIPLD